MLCHLWHINMPKPRLDTKSGKYWLARQKGKGKTEAAKELGINPRNVSHIEASQNFQALEKSSYKEEIIKHITLAQIAEEHIKVIRQDKDLGAKNTAIKIAVDRINPENEPIGDYEKVIVILKS